MVGPVLVLGVDPGLTRCGFGAVAGSPGKPLRLVAVGVVRTSVGDDAAARLLAIEAEVEGWLDRLQPDAVAVEEVFSQRNVRTVMGTAQSGAVVMVSAARRGLPVATHTPSEIKAAVTGTGSAAKRQVENMVVRLLGLAEPPKPPDAADALALAICHIWRGSAQRRIDGARVRLPSAGAVRSGRAAPARRLHQRDMAAGWAAGSAHAGRTSQ